MIKTKLLPPHTPFHKMTHIVRLASLLLLISACTWAQTSAPKGNDAEHFLKKTKGLSAEETKKVIYKAYGDLHLMEGNSRGWIDSSKKVYDGVIHKEGVSNEDPHYWKPKTPEDNLEIENGLIAFTKGANFTQIFESPDVSRLDIFSETPTQKLSYMQQYMQYTVDTIFYADGSISTFEDEKEILHVIYNNSHYSDKIIDSIATRAAYRVIVDTMKQYIVPQIGQTYNVPGMEIKILNMEGNYLRYLYKKTKEKEDVKTTMSPLNASGKKNSRISASAYQLQSNVRPQDAMDKAKDSYAELLGAMKEVTDKQKLDALIEEYISPYVLFNESDSLYHDIEIAVSVNVHRLLFQINYYQTVEDVSRKMMHNIYTYVPKLVRKEYAHIEEQEFEVEEENIVGDDYTVDDEEDEPHETETYTYYSCEDRVGFANMKGEIVIPDIYGYGSYFEGINNHYYTASTDSKQKFWFLNEDKEELELLDVDDIKPLCSSSARKEIASQQVNRLKVRDAAVIVKKDNLYALWNNEGKAITDFYQKIVCNTTTGLLTVYHENERWLIDLEGKRQ